MSKRKIHIYTPDEKRKFSAMDSFERHQLALNSFDKGNSDPVAVAPGQSARQQEELEVAKKALKCVATRLKVFNRDGLRAERKRWLEHTIDIAEAALDGKNGKDRR